MSKIVIMPNPVSNLIDRSKIANTYIADNYVFYVSRYYPHKQHVFLLQMVDKYKTVLRKERIKFYITVDKNAADIETRNFLNKISEYNLDDIIYNLGEIPNNKLSLYYGAAKCFFFPSTSETFGNPLLEAMSFDLPIIVPNLNYAKDICRDAGIYYEFNKIDDAFDKIISLLKDQSMQEKFSQRSSLRFKYFSTTDEWVDDILSLVP